MNSDVRGYITPIKTHLHLPARRLRFYLRAYRVLGVRMYNNIPEALKSINNQKLFKKELKMHLSLF